MLNLPKEIQDKYKSYIIKYNSREVIIHHSILKELVTDLVNSGCEIKDFDGFFHVPGKYTMCPVNLAMKVPTEYKKDIDILYNFIDSYIENARKDARDDGNRIDDFYVEIYFVKNG